MYSSVIKDGKIKDSKTVDVNAPMTVDVGEERRRQWRKRSKAGREERLTLLSTHDYTHTHTCTVPIRRTPPLSPPLFETTPSTATDHE